MTWKLSDEQVLDIRIRGARGESRTKLAAEYGVSRYTITRICLGYTYEWVDGPITSAPRYRYNKPRGRLGKLSDEQVIAIRDRYAAGEWACDLAEEYCVTKDTINKISHGASRENVGGPIVKTQRRSK